MITVDVRLISDSEAQLKLAIDVLKASLAACQIQRLAINLHAPHGGRRGGFLSYGTLVMPEPVGDDAPPVGVRRIGKGKGR